MCSEQNKNDSLWLDTLYIDVSCLLSPTLIPFTEIFYMVAKTQISNSYDSKNKYFWLITGKAKH